MKVEKFKVLLYLKKSGLDKSGKAPIMGRITVNRTMSQFSSKLSCTPELWNPRESRLNGKSKEAVETNAKIDKLLLAVNSAFDTLVERNTDFEAADVKEKFQGSMETQMTLLRMTDVICDDIKSRIGIDRAKSSYSTYHYMRCTLAEFIGSRYKTKDLAFGQVDETFIHDYQSFVTGEKGYAIDTVRHYLAILKKVCRKAFKDGYADKFHFQHFTLPKQTDKTPRALSRESFEKVRDVEIPEYRKSHRLARDLFLFACYTGVSYIDIVTITAKDNLFTDEDGALWLKYRRKKNELRASVKLLPEAIALIEKYRDENRDTLFPMMHHPNLKRHMKALAALAEIKDDLCYHQARHSFASLITLEAGVPIETISRMLGHSNITTTQVYARVSPKKLFEDMDRFIEATQDFQLTL
ncbi:site-specific integrase [Bacteroides helcogenes]|uniref:Integrase family protein n=1 Tax=Bacteroides helcogenes (strain ATCC 35417 / DSM 20613 / JCM 6297 / CCUG 15421 / P 36-108) TaxID=693979 RepID=E6SWE9_BACT6|nr:site-specific integrase [Bacteroides helcogenes]ADV44610.1 integrase family protein [Bacteroides helcogenes P 36-108]MDY5238901.1 site-specific integrase [Bacteroides helcogenes]